MICLGWKCQCFYFSKPEFVEVNQVTKLLGKSNFLVVSVSRESQKLERIDFFQELLNLQSPTIDSEFMFSLGQQKQSNINYNSKQFPNIKSKLLGTSLQQYTPLNACRFSPLKHAHLIPVSIKNLLILTIFPRASTS